MGISREQALDCLRSTDLIGLGMEADAVRRELHPENVVSYAVEHMATTGENLLEVIGDAVSSSLSLAIAPEIPFTAFEQTVAAVKHQFPALCVHAPSDWAILELAERSGLSTSEAVVRLRDAGLSSFASDVLGTGDPERLLELHRCAHRAGFRTSAGMVFGEGDSLEQRVEQMFEIRQLQEETGGFLAFTPAPRTYLPAKGAVEPPTAVEYMRTLAVSRMVLDNIENVESQCIAQGLKVVQMALRFGANDAGAIPSDGMKSFTEEDLRRVIRDAGFIPVERDALYRTMFLG